MHAATVLARRGRKDEARALLTPIANNPHGGREAVQASALLATIGGPPTPVE